MELRPLRYFEALARHLNFARAAEEVGISQPAMTRSIQVLEQQIGTRLFDRDRSGVRLTPQGEQILQTASDLLEHADEFARDLTATARGASGRVRFGIAPLPARVLLPALMTERLMAAPGVSNEVVVRSVEALWAGLADGEIEFFVAAAGQLPESLPVKAELLGEFPITLVVRASHPLRRGGKPSEPIPVLVSSRSVETSIMLAGLRSCVEGTVHFIEDFDSLRAVVLETNAIWVTSAFVAMEELRRGTMAILEFPGGMPPERYQIMAYRLERRSSSPSSQAIKQSLRRSIRQLTATAQDTCL